jgi:hypothetical protein
MKLHDKKVSANANSSTQIWWNSTRVCISLL